MTKWGGWSKTRLILKLIKIKFNLLKRLNKELQAVWQSATHQKQKHIPIQRKIMNFGRKQTWVWILSEFVKSSNVIHSAKSTSNQLQSFIQQLNTKKVPALMGEQTWYRDYDKEATIII